MYCNEYQYSSTNTSKLCSNSQVVFTEPVVVRYRGFSEMRFAKVIRAHGTFSEAL